MANKVVTTTYVQPSGANGAPGERLTITVKAGGTVGAYYTYTDPATGLTYDHPVELLPTNVSDAGIKAHALFVAARLAVWGP